MYKFKFSRKYFELSVICALICALFLQIARFDVACVNIKENVIRLHIIANSDTVADQNIKLAVRDAILSKTKHLFNGQTDYSDAKNIISGSLDEFSKIANSVLSEENFDYRAEVTLGNAYFKTRDYEAFSLPAGEYESLIIRLGKGEGKNWWCVVFPNVCIGAARGELEDSVNSRSAAYAYNKQKYIMRFKIVEIYEDIKNFIKK